MRERYIKIQKQFSDHKKERSENTSLNEGSPAESNVRKESEIDQSEEEHKQERNEEIADMNINIGEWDKRFKRARKERENAADDKKEAKQDC